MRSTLRATGEPGRYQKDAEAFEAMRQRFVKALANPPKEPEERYEPSLAGALFLMNDQKMLDLLERREGNLIDRLMKLKDRDAIVEELYLSVLTRLPTRQERADTRQLLEKHATDNAKKLRVLTQMTWAMLASAEFAVNH